ncbi:resolvase [Burkholderia phage vB_BceS_AH2]|uniref:Resolvase n=1 Tax=Burkholderia phage vB_BceS_AH2 TaxID=1133022 RepID=I6NSH3_9CAUD|nr:endonuclease [Burkholderia phage vB_BceS_AH2]AEY69582.1 resolvase [Burkholderia phage vB_BceS_AH2]
MNLDDYDALDFDVPLESDIESATIDFAEQHGWWVAKFVSPGQRGVPDRIFIRRGRVLFLELKRPKKKPTSQQREKHKEMRRFGAEVHWINTLEQAYDLLR